MRARRLGALVALALLLPACGAPDGESGTGDPSARDGGPLAPEFRLPDLAGGEVALADLRGRPVVIDFWATWCAPCVHQIPILNAFHERRGGEIEVLGISVDVAGREVVAPFAEEHGIAYRVLLGGESLAQAFGALGFPTLYVVGPDGVIDSAHVGVISEEALEQAVAEWASPRPAP